MTHGSLFSGMGGFDLAAEWMGWENVFHCEWKEFNQKILKYYWPNATTYTDITKSDFTIHRGTIDILTGGFPCQPYSVAGKRKGKEDERHLWPEMLRAIREISPRWVVGENVGGLVSWNGGMVFEEVQTQLEAEGYEVQAFILPACAVNAPHRRDRVWFIAYASMFQRDSKRSQEFDSRPRGNACCNFKRVSCKESFTNTSIKSGGGKLFERQRERELRGCNCEHDVANPNEERLQCQRESTKLGRGRFGEYHSQNNGTTWDNFPTQSPICTRDDGFSSQLDGITFPKWRNESIASGGNAIVPQVAYQIFKSIQQYDNL
jgi:DNA (cytosine-5)-methyltransferase 1